MALNNLRIIYQNLADTATLVASSTQGTSTPVTNLQKDPKGSVWRSIGSSASITATLATAQSIGGVVLPFTNFTSNSATLTVAGYSGSAGTGTLLYTQSGTCCPWNTLGLSTGSPNTYAYGGGTCARLWLSTVNQAISVASIVITISAPGTDYIEVSRLIVGKYWSPVYNTGYGMTATIKDLSTHDRTESGDLVTQRGPRFNALSFDLAYLAPADRIQMTKLLLGNGISKPLFVSLFPDNDSTTNYYEMERAHQIYGKLMQTPGISYHTLDMYSSQIELEEV
jgi:hypothetical protein